MEDPNVMATLVATKSHLAKRAFLLACNRDRFLPSLYREVPLDSRENTPLPGEEQDEDPVVGHKLQLTFDKPPKNPQEGFVFGWGPDCDIQIVDRENVEPENIKPVRRVSRKHFSLAFNQQRQVILRDHSKRGTCVIYDKQAKDEARSHFTWIIFPDFKKIEVIIPGARVSFRIQLCNHKHCEAQYFANIDSLFSNSRPPEERGLITPLHQLDVHSQQSSVAPSGTITPRALRRGPIYLTRKELGKGAFGTVSMVVDVSTGNYYAGKKFHLPDVKFWKKELDIMKRIAHDHIVRFVDFRDEPSPMLVMEYLHLGDLKHAHRTSPFAFEETLTISVQALDALAYLHPQGLVHRDIKPANMLVSSRYPLVIKLADLGIANYNRDGESLFKTHCGSRRYMAPELWAGTPYTPAVDIWSLGVVIFEFAYGLPKQKGDIFVPQKWQRQVVKAAREQESDQLVDYLYASMLRLNPTERHPATESFKEVRGIETNYRRMLGSRGPQAGSVPPTKTSALASVSRTSQKTTKRPRSPETNFGENNGSARKTAFRVSQISKSPTHGKTASDASKWVLHLRQTMHESVMELLQALQAEYSGSESSESHTTAQISALCQELERRKTACLYTYINDAPERMTITMERDGEQFVLASLTSSERANSVADLASYITKLAQLHHYD